MDYTVHGILQARILEWVGFPFSRGSSQPKDWTQVSCITGRFFTSWATRGTQEYWRWVVYPFSSGSSQPRNQTRVSCIASGFFTNWAIREAQAVWYKQGFELLSFCCQRVIFTLLLCFSPCTVIRIPSNTESIVIYCMKCHNLHHLLTIRMGKWGWTCWRKRLEVKTMNERLHFAVN